MPPLSVPPTPAAGPASEARPRGIGIRALVDRIQLALVENFPGRLWVEGEVSNYKVHRTSGHAFFTLKEGDAQVEAVLWSSRRAVLRFTPTDGLQVLALLSKVDFYAPQGRLRVQVERLEPQGQGALHQAREELRRKLHAEGLFAPERKRRLPVLPRAVGIATARPSAALQDLLRTLDGRFPARRVLLRPCLVQGAGAAADVAAALDDLNRDGSVDVIVVARGGGSTEDLGAFNDEAVVRAIARSRIPVVSAVGHESDWTLADEVADLRVSTPTAAASAVMPRHAQLLGDLNQLGERLRGAALRRVETARHRMATQEARLGDPRRRIDESRLRVDQLVGRAREALSRARQRVHSTLGGLESRLDRGRPATAALRTRAERLGERMEAATRAGLAAAHGEVAREQARLDALSPLAVLTRGFAVVRRADGAIVRRAATLAVGEEVRLLLAEGAAHAAVLGIDPTPGPGGSAVAAPAQTAESPPAGTPRRSRG